MGLEKNQETLGSQKPKRRVSRSELWNNRENRITCEEMCLLDLET